jgi:methylmalonyl-CoA/ethylmalonyl-CoA epimerase
MFNRVRYVVIAVKDLEESLALYTGTYGLVAAPIEEMPEGGRRTVKLDVGNAHIELAQPTDPESPLGKFIADRGEGLYLIALVVPDRQKAADELRERGARVIGDIDASGQVGEGMLFVHPKSARGVLINLVE